MKHVYIGILAGGSGERLWPLSSPEKPKQFIPFINECSLLEKTVQRLAAIPNLIKENIFVVTNKDQAPLVSSLVGASIGFIVEEPAGRNTGPAILLACHRVLACDSKALIVFLPADHFIPDQNVFAADIMSMITYLENTAVIGLLGLSPLYAATGYGYIETAASNHDNAHCFPIVSFREKPSQELALRYLAQGNMYWNLGIFVGQAAVFIEEIKQQAPDLFQQFSLYVEGLIDYVGLPKISIDYAVMERSKCIVLFKAHFVWYDVGTVRTFIQLREEYAQEKKPVISINGGNNIATTGKKRVVCIGISDLSIVETEDSLLIVHQNSLEDVKCAASLVREGSLSNANKE